MTGWRMGFAVGNPQLIAGLLKVKTNIDSGPLLSVQEVACTALENADAVIALSVQQNFAIYLGWGTTARGWALFCARPKASAHRHRAARPVEWWRLPAVQIEELDEAAEWLPLAVRIECSVEAGAWPLRVLSKRRLPFDPPRRRTPATVRPDPDGGAESPDDRDSGRRVSPPSIRP